MQRRLLCILVGVLLLTALSLPAWAAEDTGSIRVTLKQGRSASGGELTLYRVAERTEGGYQLRISFGGGMVKTEDAQSPVLAQWLADTAESGGIRRLLDADGTAEFTKLPQGLYLVTQSGAIPGYHTIRPFLVALPYGQQWHIQANPKMEAELPRTGQDPTLFFSLLGMGISGTGLLLCLTGKRKR